MEIGIHGPIARADIPIVRDLGVTWTKFAAELSGETVPDLDEQFDVAGELGLRCVVDLRTSRDYIERGRFKLHEQLAAAGEFEHCPEGLSHAEQLAIVARNNRRANDLLYPRLYETAQRTVERYGDRCRDWEFWGEAACPWVSGKVFGDQSEMYPYLLRGVSRAIKEAQPTARVWTGGNGMDLQLAFYYACLDQDAGDSFDVCNLHPYFMRIRDRDNADFVLEREYGRLREALRTKGQDQPFAATEWGYPCLDVDSVPHEQYLRSHVVSEGIRPLLWSDAPQWFATDLQAMERHGFEVVIVHFLRDQPDPEGYWGGYCGLIDAQGRRKNVWDVVQRWAWRGRESSD